MDRERDLLPRRGPEPANDEAAAWLADNPASAEKLTELVPGAIVEVVDGEVLVLVPDGTGGWHVLAAAAEDGTFVRPRGMRRRKRRLEITPEAQLQRQLLDEHRAAQEDDLVQEFEDDTADEELEEDADRERVDEHRVLLDRFPIATGALSAAFLADHPFAASALATYLPGAKLYALADGRMVAEISDGLPGGYFARFQVLNDGSFATLSGDKALSPEMVSSGFSLMVSKHHAVGHQAIKWLAANPGAAAVINGLPKGAIIDASKTNFCRVTYPGLMPHGYDLELQVQDTGQLWTGDKRTRLTGKTIHSVVAEHRREVLVSRGHSKGINAAPAPGQFA